MSITGALNKAGYKQEVSTAGDKPILTGVYKAMFVDFKNDPNGQYGAQLSAQFKIVERLAGRESKSTFPEFTGYYKTDEKYSASKRNGIAKLLNGFFSVGIQINTSSDEALMESLNSQKGVAEVYIKGYSKKAQKNTGTKEAPVWEEDDTKAPKQDFTFMTKVNAEKEAKKQQNKDGHPL